MRQGRLDGWIEGRRGLGLCACAARLRSGDNTGRLPFVGRRRAMTATAPGVAVVA